MLELSDAIGERSPSRLLRCINKLLERRVQARFSDTDPSFEEWMALKLLFDGVAENAGDLARDLGIASGATTRLIDSIEKQGFVERDRTRQDRRVVLVKLTALGKRHYLSKVPDMVDCWNEIFEDFQTHEVVQLITLLAKLKGAFERTAG
ncbi:MarR family winged helix-turn-helix transcriptional regulator [Ottowia thiooxydans]|uniref:MarR family winged helix-turn-helix transcriptional regulator n=1 Tax=Ottowia thiooxydans TaxID=219182 RepID=UPI001FE174E8|nr:MarR family transcriptional regulator [Ottowia thiooxydans]